MLSDSNLGAETLSKPPSAASKSTSSLLGVLVTCAVEALDPTLVEQVASGFS